MVPTARFVTLVFLAAVACSVYACARSVPMVYALSPATPSAREIAALESDYQRAITEGDRLRQAELLADDYMFIAATGEMLDKQMALKRLHEFVSVTDERGYRANESGDTVIVTMKAVVVRSGGEESVTRTTRVWTKRQNQWQVIFGQQTSLEPAGEPPTSQLE